mgnify:CR=1 FL=1
MPIISQKNTNEKQILSLPEASERIPGSFLRLYGGSHDYSVFKVHHTGSGKQQQQGSAHLGRTILRLLR